MSSEKVWPAMARAFEQKTGDLAPEQVNQGGCNCKVEHVIGGRQGTFTK